MTKISKKRARKAIKRTAKTVRQVTAAVGPVVAGFAAGLAARDVSSERSSYLEGIGQDLARLVKTIGNGKLMTSRLFGTASSGSSESGVSTASADTRQEATPQTPPGGSIGSPLEASFEPSPSA